MLLLLAVDFFFLLLAHSFEESEKYWENDDFINHPTRFPPPIKHQKVIKLNRRFYFRKLNFSQQRSAEAIFFVVLRRSELKIRLTRKSFRCCRPSRLLWPNKTIINRFSIFFDGTQSVSEERVAQK
jgi:hypothetical protein